MVLTSFYVSRRECQPQDILGLVSDIRGIDGSQSKFTECAASANQHFSTVAARVISACKTLLLYNAAQSV